VPVVAVIVALVSPLAAHASQALVHVEVESGHVNANGSATVRLVYSCPAGSQRPRPLDGPIYQQVVAVYQIREGGEHVRSDFTSLFDLLTCDGANHSLTTTFPTSFDGQPFNSDLPLRVEAVLELTIPGSGRGVALSDEHKTFLPPGDPDADIDILLVRRIDAGHAVHVGMSVMCLPVVESEIESFSFLRVWQDSSKGRVEARALRFPDVTCDGTFHHVGTTMRVPVGSGEPDTFSARLPVVVLALDSIAPRRGEVRTLSLE
jgi:hypothetical protein